MTDLAFVKDAARPGLAEIKLGKLAEDRAGQVKP
jgi:hypothetical protein